MRFHTTPQTVRQFLLRVLAAAVNGASEGLSALVLETIAPGGQAGSSSRIENYLGFPLGISGQDLAGRAFVQAEKFGAQIAVARRATAIRCDTQPFPIECDGHGPVRGQAVVIACGAEYCKLQIGNLEPLTFCSGGNEPSRMLLILLRVDKGYTRQKQRV